MGSPFVVTIEARNDLLEIWTYIAERNLDSADGVLADFRVMFDRLARTPAIGHYRADLADSRYRFWTVYSYVIVYRWTVAPIEIIAIVHGARQLDAFLQDRLAGQSGSGSSTNERPG
jgi:antitoxin ParD1/3/4/toxin ParE1/3/4